MDDDELLSHIRLTYDYNPNTGVFMHKEGGLRGKRSGSLYSRNSDSMKYRNMTIKGRKYYEHRVAFYYMTGSCPEVVDHINGDGADNRWSNLRSSSAKLNQKNRVIAKNNTSGYPGITRNKQFWQVTINDQGKSIYLGIHLDKFEAICARKSAENKYQHRTRMQ